MYYKAIFFDVDETLYPAGSNLVGVVEARMNRFIDEQFAKGRFGSVRPSRDKLYQTYGTTAKGLNVEHHVDTFEFMHYINEFDLSPHLSASDEVRSMIRRIPLKKYLLTNADRFHAQRVLKRLNLADCFDGMVDSIDIFPDIKPSRKAYEFALRITNETDPTKCIFVDDKNENITTAHELGFFAVQVGLGDVSPAADAVIAEITDLPKLGLYQEKPDAE